jgi:hypothetical protein
MGLFRKKADPITSRAKELNQRIAKLEAEIQKLNTKPGKPSNPGTSAGVTPKIRTQPSRLSEAPSRPVSAKAAARDPIFESVENTAPAAADSSSAHYNDLGLRKYDLVAAWHRLRNIFRGPEAHNPKLVSYLAAGSIRGLRPLRYEKRIARNRTIALAVILLVVLWGLIAISFNHR